MEQQALKELAKELYFSQVTVEIYRDSFLEHLDKKTVVDKREEGFYCSMCGKFSKMQQMPSGKDCIIFPHRTSDEMWIVNYHYDGCRGWD